MSTAYAYCGVEGCTGVPSDFTGSNLRFRILSQQTQPTDELTRHRNERPSILTITAISRFVQAEMADRFYPATDADAPANATPPYPPSIHAANELDPIVISQMELETHHRGKRTTVRVLEPSIRLGGALVTTVEDEQDTPVLLLLCQQPSEAFLPAEQILRVGSCYMIKEPFLTVAPDGSDSLRVDHPSDILLMSQDHELLPVALRKSDHLVKGSVHIRMEGNDAVGKKRWAEAEHL